MELVGIFRVLRRHRVLVAAGLIPALLVALALMFEVSIAPPGVASREATAGLATSRVLLVARDEPSADLGTAVTTSLAARSILLADLLATDRARTELARRASLSVTDLAVLGPAAGAPPLALPLALEATDAAATGPEPYRVTADADGIIPIITLRTTAPDAAAAGRVADAAAATLERLSAGNPGSRPTVAVERLGPAVLRTTVSSPGIAGALVAAALTFLVWCTGIVLVVGVHRSVRARRGRPAAARRASAIS